MSTPRKRRWIDVLRRTAGVADDERQRSTGALDDAALWATHDRASLALKDAAARAERVAATLARQRSQGEAVLERATLVLTRVEGLAPPLARTQDALDKLGVVALNAGLEGARSGEPLGRALLLLSEEIRLLATRGGDASHELAEANGAVAAEASELRKQVERWRTEASELGQDAGQLQAASSAAGKALDELGGRMRRATGIDPEMARIVALAAEHARGLIGALSSLTTAAPGAPVLIALRPVIGPLVRLLGELDARTTDDDDEGEVEGS